MAKGAMYGGFFATPTLSLPKRREPTRSRIALRLSYWLSNLVKIDAKISVGQSSL
jgi:hypothetical protein